MLEWFEIEDGEHVAGERLAVALIEDRGCLLRVIEIVEDPDDEESVLETTVSITFIKDAKLSDFGIY